MTIKKRAQFAMASVMVVSMLFKFEGDDTVEQ